MWPRPRPARPRTTASSVGVALEVPDIRHCLVDEVGGVELLEPGPYERTRQVDLHARWHDAEHPTGRSPRADMLPPM
jgi:hypothetical protein